jgi:hypothetical protein
MGTDEEVRKYAGLAALFSAVAHERFSGEEQSLPWNRFQANLTLYQHTFEVFDRREGNGQLRVNNEVDAKGSLQARGLELLL